MTSDAQPLLPQEFLDSFSRRELPIPPLPDCAVQALRLVDRELYATLSEPPAWLYGTALPLAYLEDLAGELTDLEDDLPPPPPASTQDASATPFATDSAGFLCGFIGEGWQNRGWRYLYSGARLRIGIALPFDSVYADPEADRRDILAAIDSLRACLLHTGGGARLGNATPCTLSWSIDAYGTRFRLRDDQGGVVREGNSLDALLDFFETCGAAQGADNTV